MPNNKLNNLALAIRFFTGMKNFHGNPEFEKLKRKVFKTILQGAIVKLTADDWDGFYLTVHKNYMVMKLKKAVLQSNHIYSGYRADTFEVDLYQMDEKQPMKKLKDSWHLYYFYDKKRVGVTHNQITNDMNQEEQKVDVTETEQHKSYYFKRFVGFESEKEPKSYFVEIESDSDFSKRYTSFIDTMVTPEEIELDQNGPKLKKKAKN